MNAEEIWNWLRNEDNRATLAFLGTGLLALLGMAWAGLKWVFRTNASRKEENSKSTTNITHGNSSHIISNPGDVSIITNNIEKSFGLGGSSFEISKYWEHLKFSFHRDEYVHPLIIKELIGLISDSDHAVVAIDLSKSNDSNRFHGDYHVLSMEGGNWIRWIEPEPWKNFRPEALFYKYVGTSKSGIHIIHCRQSTGGTAVFNFLLLLALEADTSFFQIGKNYELRSRVLIKVLGSISLGDRYEGSITFANDTLRIGEDSSQMAHGGRDYPDSLHIE